MDIQRPRVGRSRLRNIVLNIVRAQLEVVGYVLGRAYECQITRVVSESRGIDYVFGIDIPCLSKRIKPENVDSAISDLRSKTDGDHGLYIRRCLGDLASAMKYPDDTGFYCYRAVEALRLHCGVVNGLAPDDKSGQWEAFRASSGCSEKELRELEKSATAVRHGDVVGVSGGDRERLFTLTWDIVDKYLAKV